MLLLTSFIMYPSAGLNALFFLVFVSDTSVAKPLEKRYDLDGNGVPDLCEVYNSAADCLEDDGSWTTFAASETGFKVGSTVILTSSLSETAIPTTAATVTLPTGSLTAPSQFAEGKGTK